MTTDHQKKRVGRNENRIEISTFILVKISSGYAFGYVQFPVTFRPGKVDLSICVQARGDYSILFT